jgi:hypothetical protein
MTTTQIDDSKPITFSSEDWEHLIDTFDKKNLRFECPELREAAVRYLIIAKESEQHIKDEFMSSLSPKVLEEADKACHKFKKAVEENLKFMSTYQLDNNP